MAKLKDSGVTTIIEVLDARYGMRPGMLAATSAEYFPEWLIGSGGPTGGGAFPGDLPILVRTADKQQMAHAFGLIWSPALRGEPSATNPFQWFWGTDKGSIWSGAQAMVGAMYSRIHLAGPDLTAAKMKPGALPSKPAGGQFSNAVLTPAAGYDKDGDPIIDATLGWWSTDTTGFDPATTRRGRRRVHVPRRRQAVRAGQLPEEQEGLLRQVAHHDGLRLHRSTRRASRRARLPVHRMPELGKRFTGTVPALDAAPIVAHCEAGYPPQPSLRSVSRLG